MSKHTPGPWEYEASTKTIRSQPSNFWLATMDSWDGAIDHAANARLIAAAPDLLMACKATLAGLKDMTTEAFARGEDRKYRDMLEDAIERAEGK